MSGSLDGFDRNAPTLWRDLFSELGDLKRTRSAGKDGSVAERGFRAAWVALVAGEPLHSVMLTCTAGALAAARLGDIDPVKLEALGLDVDDTRAVLRRAFDAVTQEMDASFVATLREGLSCSLPNGAAPPFVDALALQPRAGATCPGKPRILLEPPENHAEHCWAVAIYGVLLASRYGADPGTVFLAGLSHHLHNAAMPDSGFTGEVLLGDKLDAIYAFATDLALADLDEPLRGKVVAARAVLSDTATAEGRAFHAADVIDRVMQLSQHLKVAQVTMPMLLDEWALVHDGPVKPFHDRVLADMGLT